MTTTEDEALYLYYLTAPEYFGALEVRRVDGADRLLAHRHADLVALLGIVAIDEFCGPEAERRLSDLGWVSQRALRHERVIEDGFRRGPVLPAGFGTLFSSIEAVERFIEQNRRTAVDFLGAVRGQEEWGIKALLERPAAKKWLSTQMASAAVEEIPASPGLRYVQARRAEAMAEKQLARWLLESCEAIALSLDEFATDRRQRKILDTAVAGDARELVLNLATLVPHDRLGALVSHIERVNAERSAQGLSFVLNGPWPPYSFCPPLAAPR
ncbi:MAG TPA: GvpL/GvpF family gas vesicle protein [Candidatus Binataceae bacterium]|nr:GvpL/GvpF family gas vesicle protein [Candidatus Binataceae bacterium]